MVVFQNQLFAVHAEIFIQCMQSIRDSCCCVCCHASDEYKTT